MLLFKRTTLLALGFSALCFAATASEDERTRHYEFEKPTSNIEAKKLYDASYSEIAVVLEKEKLEVSDLEEVHRLSYALEEAVEWFEAKKAYSKELVEALEHDVEELHEASEEHEEAKTREYFAKLTKAKSQL